MRVHSPQQLFTLPAKQGKAAAQRFTAADRGSFFSTLQQSLKNVVKKAADSVASFIKFSAEPASSAASTPAQLKSIPAVARQSQIATTSAATPSETKSEKAATVLPSSERKKSDSPAATVQQTHAAATGLPTSNYVRATIPTVPNQSTKTVKTESAAIPITTASGGTAVPRNPRVIAGDASQSKTTLPLNAKTPQSASSPSIPARASVLHGQESVPDTATQSIKPAQTSVLGSRETIPSDTKQVAIAVKAEAIGVVQKDIKQGASAFRKYESAQVISEIKPSTQQNKPLYKAANTAAAIASETRTTAEAPQIKQTPVSQAPTVGSNRISVAKPNTNEAAKPAEPSTVRTAINPQVSANTQKAAASVPYASSSVGDIPANIQKTQKTAARQTAVEQNAALSTKETAAENPQPNVFRQISNFWQRFTGTTTAQRMADVTQAPVTAPKDVPASKVKEAIPEGRIAQVRESFRKWEKGTETVPVARTNSTTQKAPVSTTIPSAPSVQTLANAPAGQTNAALNTNTQKTVEGNRLPESPTVVQPSKTPNTAAVPASVKRSEVSVAAPSAVNNERKTLPSESAIPKAQAVKTEDRAQPKTADSAKSTEPIKKETTPVQQTVSEVPKAADKNPSVQPQKSFWGMRVSAEPSDTRVPSKPINIGSEKNSASEGKTLPTPANPAANSNAPWSVNPEQSVRDSIFKTNENANAPRAAVSESHTPKQAVERHSKSPIVQQPSVKPAEVRSVHTQPARAAVVEKNVQSAEQTTTAASNPKEIAAAVSQPVEVRYAQTRRTVGSLFRKIISKQPAHIAETNTAQPAKDSGTASRSTPENSIVSSRAQDAAVRPNEQKPVNELPVSSQQTRNQTPTSSAKPAVAVSKALPQPVVNLVQTAQPENAAKYSTADSEPRTTQTDTARIKTEVTMPTYAPAVLDREPRSSANSERTAGSARQQASTNETAALNTQPTTDTPSAAATTSTAPARESLPVAEAVVRPLRMLWTTEQIKELQSLAQRALQTVQTVADGTSQAVFTWTPENLGPLQFKIITRKDDVEIEINSSRQDVADALEEGRGTIERIIGDLGLRIERFDIRVRVPSAASDQAMTAFNEHHPERNSQAQQDGSTPVLTDGAVEEGAEEPTPTRRRLAEHEWVA